jgi:TPR repeat protein
MIKSRRPGFQERCTRWLLLLTFLHTLPVIWLTPVAGGTAPTAALLAYGFAGVLSFDREGIALALMALLPALVYTGLAWGLAWLFAKLLRRGRPAVRAWLLGYMTMALLLAVHFPIYLVGGHNSSSSSDLIGLFDNTISHHTLVSYWVALHAMLFTLFAGSLVREGHAFIAPIERWARPVFRTVGIIVFGATLTLKYDLFFCRPLAELGVARAQVCVARTAGHEQRYWYERAAAQGDGEAIAWLIDRTPNRKTRLTWLRKGAEEGDPAIQFALYQWLLRAPGADAQAEAERWLLLAAEGDSADAQMALVERLSRILYRTHSSDGLAERNVWLERAAKLGSRPAKLHLARHYSDGSMGYPADFGRARAYYRELSVVDELTKYERTLQLDAAVYQRRLSELDAWEAGVESRDPEVMKAVAKRYLASQYPGPGVRELGTRLMEELARDGDEAVRDELTVMLRTGSGGVEKDVEAAKSWLLKAAEAGDPEAMERLTGNYMSGREGFAVDYPQARRWMEARLARDEGSNEPEAQARRKNLENDLRYIDRMGERAGGQMLSSTDLVRLGQRKDADSQFEHALQLLAGHGSQRRAEAISQLEKAANKGHGEAAWRLFEIYERGFPKEVDLAAALRMLKLAVANHHFDATRKLAMSYENGKRGLAVDLPKAIELYEGALEAGHDNRHGWNLDPEVFNHYRWLESRLRQARLKLDAQTGGRVAHR